MERLTKLNPLSGEIERLGLPQQLYKKLAEYENAEEQGLIVRLPCKVGDKIYYIYHGENAYMVEATIISIKQTLGLCSRVILETMVKKHFSDGKPFHEILDFGRENETWFRNKIDAERKMEWWNER